MTRLRTSDIKGIGRELEDYSAQLLTKTGRTLLGLACHACNSDEWQVQKDLTFFKTAVIPMTCGQGALAGFSESVRDIAAFLGCRAFVTEQTDAGGLAEAFTRKSELLLLADENHYLALHLGKKLVIDNDTATAQGFVAGMDLMAQGLSGKKCLVIGCGAVGRQAGLALARRRAWVTLFDSEPAKAAAALSFLEALYPDRFSLCPSLEQGLKAHRLLFEATNSSNVISREWIGPETCIAAPGMPLGLNPEALHAAGDRILHDPLQIGTATMIVKALNE